MHSRRRDRDVVRQGFRFIAGRANSHMQSIHKRTTPSPEERRATLVGGYRGSVSARFDLPQVTFHSDSFSGEESETK